MIGPAKSKVPRKNSDLIVGSVIAGCVALVMLITALFVRQTVIDLRQMETASSDSMQWALPQVEVEFQRFLYALELKDTGGLEEVRIRYDVLYSRIYTLTQSQVFQEVMDDQTFQSSLRDVKTFIQSALPLMDGSDAELVAALPSLSQSARDLRPTVRRLASSGLSHFSKQNQLRRNEVAGTLGRLAMVTGLLLIALGTLSVFLFLSNRNTTAKSRDLAQANNRMNTILSTSLDGVIVTDIDGRVQEFNAAAEQIFRCRQVDAIGRTIGELFVPDDMKWAYDIEVARIRDANNPRIAGKGRMQFRALRADGTVFPMELAVQLAEDGKQRLLIAFIRDVSKRVRAQHELVEARDRALAGEKAKAEILTVMSHEIRTPLNGLLGNLSLLQDSHLGPDQAQIVRNMDISGEILMGHVDAVLDISRLEAGKLELSFETVSLDELMQSVVDGQSGLAEGNGSVIEWRWVGPRLEWVTADRKRVLQVLLNLVGNSVKFTENGRIVIEAELIDGADASPQTPREVEFRISDTGIGIPEADLDTVFEDFKTSDASFGRTSGGTGLGLGISRRLVHAMGGDIGAESILGEGSTFWIRLPFVPADAPDTTQHSSDPSPPRQSLNVLLVEDNEINRQVAVAMLKRDGHQVWHAVDGKSGVDLAAQTKFDLILMDISMPVMDGLEATRRIRKGSGPSSDTTIVALSANVMPGDQSRFFDAGMDAFLGKPLSLDTLRNTLNNVRLRSIAHSETAIRHDEKILLKDQVTEMRDNMGPAVFGDLVDRFLEEGDMLLANLPEIGQDALGKFAADCHKVAGSAAVFGAVAFRTALIRLENAAKSAELSDLQKELPTISRLWAETRAALRAAK